MVYPSHYPHGELGIASRTPSRTRSSQVAISRARERDKKLGIKEPEHIRPWLQAFTLGKPEYGAAAARGAEEGGVRLGLRRLGDVEPGLDLRRVHAGAGEDAGVAEEVAARRTGARCSITGAQLRESMLPSRPSVPAPRLRPRTPSISRSTSPSVV